MCRYEAQYSCDLAVVNDIDKDDAKCPDCQIKLQEEDEALTSAGIGTILLAKTSQSRYAYEYFAGGSYATSRLHWYCRACMVGTTNLMHILNNPRGGGGVMGEGGGAGVLKSPPKNTPKIPNLKLFDPSNPKDQRYNFLYVSYM